MPATFPSHAAVVLPLKWWKPRWFDGVALTVGSAAPDIAYALDGTWLEWPVRSLPPTWALAHSWPGTVLWGLPVTLACCWIIRAAFRFRAPGLLVTACSAVIGAASHVLWDRLAVDPVADIASSVLGAIVTLTLLLVHFGRLKPGAAATLPTAARGAAPLDPGDAANLLETGQGEASAVEERIAQTGSAANLDPAGGLAVERREGRRELADSAAPATATGLKAGLGGVNWVVTGAVIAAGTAAVPFLPGAGLAHTTGVRLLLVASVAVVAGRVMRRTER